MHNQLTPVTYKTMESPMKQPKIDKTIIEDLLNQTSELCTEILSSVSDEWDTILNEADNDIKVKKLHAALIKEQIRRETAEKLSREIKLYADTLKEQTTQRITDIRDHLESQQAFLSGQIRQLKREAEEDLNYYREQLEKATQTIAQLKASK